MGAVEAVLTYGMSGWPTWVHHAHRELSWRVLEVIEPGQHPPQPSVIDKYVLKVHGPLAYLPGRRGRLYIAARRHGGRWLVEPAASAYPRRGRPPEG